LGVISINFCSLPLLYCNIALKVIRDLCATNKRVGAIKVVARLEDLSGPFATTLSLHYSYTSVL